MRFTMRQHCTGGLVRLVRQRAVCPSSRGSNKDKARVMLYLTMIDGSPRRIDQVESAEIEGGQLVCRGRDGLIVAIFDAPLISSFGNNEAFARDSRIRLTRRAMRT